MSEMLGNQYFLARKFCEALNELEEAYLKDPRNKSIKKKLIICYIKTNQIDRAFSHFLELCKDDINFIINTDPIIDDCPCPDIIFELENAINSEDPDKKNLSLGMLWLFCDVTISLKYFSLLHKNKEVGFLLNKLHELQKHIH